MPRNAFGSTANSTTNGRRSNQARCKVSSSASGWSRVACDTTSLGDSAQGSGGAIPGSTTTPRPSSGGPKCCVAIAQSYRRAVLEKHDDGALLASLEPLPRLRRAHSIYDRRIMEPIKVGWLGSALDGPGGGYDKIHRLAFDEAVEEGVLDRPYGVRHPSGEWDCPGDRLRMCDRRLFRRLVDEGCVVVAGACIAPTTQ